MIAGPLILNIDGRKPRSHRASVTVSGFRDVTDDPRRPCHRKLTGQRQLYCETDRPQARCEMGFPIMSVANEQSQRDCLARPVKVTEEPADEKVSQTKVSQEPRMEMKNKPEARTGSRRSEFRCALEGDRCVPGRVSVPATSRLRRR